MLHGSGGTPVAGAAAAAALEVALLLPLVDGAGAMTNAWA
jgi:hypothetical protein